MRRFYRGDFVVFYGPGRAAHYMTVQESSKKGTLVLHAHSGQLVVTQSANPALRKARFWERLILRGRFPRLERSGQRIFGKRAGTSA